MIEPQGGLEGERLVYTYTADAGTAKRMTRATLRLWRSSSKALLLVYGGLLLLGLVKALEGEWYWALAVVMALPFGVGSQIWALARRWRSMVPPGTRFETEFGPTSMVIRTASTTAEVQLSSIRTVRELGDAVAFRLDNQMVHHMLPRENFPQAELDRVRALVAARSR